LSSIGFGLFKSLVENEVSFSTLNDYQVNENHFRDKEVEAYHFVKEFILDYGTYPRLETIARQIGAVEAFNNLPSEPVEYWLKEVQERKRYADVRECMIDMRGCLENQELTEALDIMGTRYLALRESYSSRRLASLRDVQREVLLKHDEYQNNPDIPGLSFGFPFLDTVSGGAQNGDFIVIVGQTGVGKTYLALKIGYSSYLTGKNVVVLSTEMPNLQAARRVLAMEGRFSTTDLKLGRLSYFGRERADQIIDRGAAIQNEVGNFFYLLPGGMFPKVEDFAIVVKELKPDFAIVDGAYLLQGTARQWWEKNMEVAQVLKNLALNNDIPILATYQYGKKDTGKLEGVGGGFAIPQIASMVLSFEFERKEDIGSLQEVQHRVLRLTKGRDGESGSMQIEYNMKATRLVQKKVLSGRYSDEELIDPDLSAQMDLQDYAEI